MGYGHAITTLTVCRLVWIQQQSLSVITGTYVSTCWCAFVWSNLLVKYAMLVKCSAQYIKCLCLLLLRMQGAVMMMEFGYDGKILETFTPFGIDQSKETFPMWLVKAEALPFA